MANQVFFLLLDSPLFCWYLSPVQKEITHLTRILMHPLIHLFFRWTSELSRDGYKEKKAELRVKAAELASFPGLIEKRLLSALLVFLLRRKRKVFKDRRDHLKHLFFPYRTFIIHRRMFIKSWTGYELLGIFPLLFGIDSIEQNRYIYFKIMSRFFKQGSQSLGHSTPLWYFSA